MFLLLSPVVGLASRLAFLAGALFYGTNVGRAAGNESLWAARPWLEGAVNSFIELAQIALALTARLLNVVPLYLPLLWP